MRINPDNKKIRYSGRIDWRNPKEPIWVYPCTSAEFKFTGRYLKIFLKNKNEYWQNYLGCILDGVQSCYYLDNEKENEIEIRVPENENGEHHVLFFKRQDSCHEMHILGFEIEDGAKLLELPDAPTKKIEVYGDSVSAGEVTEAVDYTGKTDPEHQGGYSNSWYSYAWMTARMLNAQIHDIAQGGIALKDVEYQVTELTTQLIQKSEAMWAYASYEPEQEIEEAGIHYTLTSLSKDEWMQTDRLKNVTKYLSCQEGQEVSETLDVETADEVTGEALYGTIGRIELKEDGADWKEGALEEWDIYSWNGESWVYQRNDECFYATEESPWFEGYEAVFMQEHHLDGVFNQITSIEWYGDGWQDEEGNWKRSVRITGNKMVPRYQAIYSGDVAQPDLPMVCYKAQYTSDPQGYLITADVTYEKMQEEAVQEEENADESILKSISEELIKTLQQNKTNEKFWYLLLAALMAVSVGLQTAVIFVLAFRER